MQKKKIAMLTAALAACLSLAVGSTMAYLTDSEQAVNTFTVGDVTVDLTETWWPGNDSPYVKDLVPNSMVRKNPKVVNTGTNPAIVFLKMTVPVVSTAIVDPNGSGDTTAVPQEIFHFTNTGWRNENGFFARYNNFNTPFIPDMETGGYGGQYYTGVPWVELTSKEEGWNHTDGYTGNTRTYVFGYPTTVFPGESTSVLFEIAQLRNFIEGTIAPGTELDVKIETYAIQTDWLLDNTGNFIDLGEDWDWFSPETFVDSPVTTREHLSQMEEQLTQIYDIFITQGTSTNPPDAATNNVLDLAQNERVTPTPTPTATPTPTPTPAG